MSNLSYYNAFYPQKGKTAGEVALLEKIQLLLGAHLSGENSPKKVQSHSPSPGYTPSKRFYVAIDTSVWCLYCICCNCFI